MYELPSGERFKVMYLVGEEHRKERCFYHRKENY